MRPVPRFEAGKISSHGSVRALVEDHLGAGIRVRARVVGFREPAGRWNAIFGRFDVAQEADLDLSGISPRGDVVVAEEILSGVDFLAVLEPALMAKPLKVGGHEFVDHGMGEEWGAGRATVEWREYETGWPCIVAASKAEAHAGRPPPKLIEADGPTGVFDGLDELVGAVASIAAPPGWVGQDLRHRRVQILIWDYRGRIDDCDINDSSVLISVSPPSTKGLRVVGTLVGATKKEPFSVDAPARYQKDLGEEVASVKLELKFGEELLEELSQGTARSTKTHADRHATAAPTTVEARGMTEWRGHKKYTVFISATQKDLLAEREGVAGEILKAGHIPCGMEQFSATGHPSWTIIEKTIDLCDYYVLVIAGRYGSVDDTTGISWTEREYNYALKLGLPVLAFIRDDTSIMKADTEEDAARLAKLNAFVARVEGSVQRERWGTKQDLCGKVGVALLKRILDDERGGTPRLGWYRGNDVPTGSGPVGNVYWLANNLAYTAYALHRKDWVSALREWNHAIHHAQEVGIPNDLRERLRALQDEDFVNNDNVRTAVIGKLHDLWSEIGAAVAAQQADFANRDVQEDSKDAAKTKRTLSGVSVRPPFVPDPAASTSTVAPSASSTTTSTSGLGLADLRRLIAEVEHLERRAHDVNLWAEGHGGDWKPRQPVYLTPTLETVGPLVVTLVPDSHQATVSRSLVTLREAVSEANSTELGRSQGNPAKAIKREAAALLRHLHEIEAGLQ